MVEKEADDVEIRLRQPDDAEWAEVGGAQKCVKIARAPERSRDQPSVTGGRERDRAVAEPDRGRCCTRLGTFEDESPHHRLLVVYRCCDSKVRRVRCNELAPTTILQQKRAGWIRHRNQHGWIGA